MKVLRNYPLKVAIKKLFAIILFHLPFLLHNKYYLINYYGGKIYLNVKESKMMCSRFFGVYEYWKTQLFLDLVEEGMNIVDVGVNKGYFSLLFAKLMKDRGKVLSFEPEPNNCLWFRKSIEANRYGCIKLFQYALSNKEGSANFYRGEKSGWGSLFLDNVATEKEFITILTRKLDNVLKDEGIDKVDIIKIDVQGADLLVLKGAEKTLKMGNTKIVMDVDVRSLEERNQLSDFLKSCGFEIFRIGKELVSIEKIDEKTNEIYAIKA